MKLPVCAMQALGFVVADRCARRGCQTGQETMDSVMHHETRPTHLQSWFIHNLTIALFTCKHSSVPLRSCMLPPAAAPESRPASAQKADRNEPHSRENKERARNARTLRRMKRNERVHRDEREDRAGRIILRRSRREEEAVEPAAFVRWPACPKSISTKGQQKGEGSGLGGSR